VTEDPYANTRGHPESLAAGPTQATAPRLDSPTIVAAVPAATTASPSPLSGLDQWVSAERLLEILWDEKSRPSLQWIRKETKRRMLPHIRRGRLIFYRPRSVMEWYSQRECRPSNMK